MAENEWLPLVLADMETADGCYVMVCFRHTEGCGGFLQIAQGTGLSFCAKCRESIPASFSSPNLEPIRVGP